MNISTSGITEQELEDIDFRSKTPHTNTAEVNRNIVAYDVYRLIDHIRAQAIENKRFKTALRKIVSLNIPMPDEVFNLANDALEGVEPK